MVDLQFNVNLMDLNNPYNDITDYNPGLVALIPGLGLPPQMIRLSRQFNSRYTLLDKIIGYKNYDLDKAISSINLYRGIDNFIKDIDDNIYSGGNGYTNTEISDAEVVLDLTKYISKRILKFLPYESRQTLLNIYILIYSSLPLLLPKTLINQQIIMKTFDMLINQETFVNINPIILPLYNGSEDMVINTINNGINNKLRIIYSNRGFLIDSLNEVYITRYITRYNFIWKNSDFIDPIIDIIMKYENQDSSNKYVNFTNWKQIDITQQLNDNINTERDMRLYFIKLSSRFLRNNPAWIV